MGAGEMGSGGWRVFGSRYDGGRLRRPPGHVWRDTCQTDCVASFFLWWFVLPGVTRQLRL